MEQFKKRLAEATSTTGEGGIPNVAAIAADANGSLYTQNLIVQPLPGVG
jgi:hypothetical protein